MIESHVVIQRSLRIPVTEIKFRTSRSGGPGGQNVNKLETRVELLFDIDNSQSISGELRQCLKEKLSSKIDSTGVLRIVVQDSRSQWKNKQLAIKKFTDLIRSALVPHKKRIATKSTRASKENRLKRKKMRSETKKLRKNTFSE